MITDPTAIGPSMESEVVASVLVQGASLLARPKKSVESEHNGPKWRPQVESGEPPIVKIRYPNLIVQCAVGTVTGTVTSTVTMAGLQRKIDDPGPSVRGEGH